MAPAALFNRRTVVWLVLSGGAAFCVMLTLSVLGDPAAGNVTTSSVFSRSAVGHVAFAELLRAQGRQVKPNRSRKALGVTEDDLLLILAPHTADHDLEHLRTLVADAVSDKRSVLLALPKWRTSPSSQTRGWISEARLMDADRAAKPLGVVDALAGATIARPQDAPGWRGFGAWFRTAPPTVEQPQLIEHDALVPMIGGAGAVLVGWVPNARLWVLSDPDLLTNHGLRRGDNATLMLTLIERLLPAADGAVVFDETLHGFAIVPSLWRLLFAPPYLAATLLALGAMALTVWRAAARFGAPVDANAGPAFRGGHGQLIENAGRLLAGGGHGALVAKRYAEVTVAEARRRLQLPVEPVATDRSTAALNAIAARRGVRARLPTSGDKQRPMALARSCQRWAREMFGDD